MAPATLEYAVSPDAVNENSTAFGRLGSARGETLIHAYPWISAGQKKVAQPPAL